MHETRENLITRQDIDAMADEDLLPFARKHHGMLGDRFGKMQNFYNPRLLDEPYLLRRLCRLDMEQFTRLTQEQNRREYFAGGRWAAVLLSQGGTLPEDVLKKQEWAMPDTLVRVQENPPGHILGEVSEFDRPLDSALFLEVSQKARDLWAAQPAQYHLRTTQCRQLSAALVMRKKWLGASHTDSAAALYALGWKPLDVMLAYLAGETSCYDDSIDPDCAADAARRDPDAARRLLDPDRYRAYFAGQLHPSYDMDMAKCWTGLLYFHAHGSWTDTAPLEKGHRLRRMNTFYQETLARLGDSNRPRRDFEEELRRLGLLHSETPADWDDFKQTKKRRLALTRALVWGYSWRAAELLTALDTGRAEVFTSLLWGVYQEDRLETAFLLDAAGQAQDIDGQVVELLPDAAVELVSPAELDKKELVQWKKRLKEAGGKPCIRQLSLPAAPPDFRVFEGAVTKHIALYSAVGKWGMDTGSLPCRCRADLTDPLHGYGARIRFDRVWDGPEYSGDDVDVLGVEFFRLDPIPFGDALPDRAILPPGALSPRFLAAAGAAFRQLTGVK